MASETSAQRAPRRKHSKAFKAQILQACREPGASLSGIAIAHDLNPNMVQRWRREARYGKLALPEAPAFIPVVAASTPLQAAKHPCVQDAPLPVIEVRLQRGTLQAQVRWPVQAADDCSAFLRELLR